MQSIPSREVPDITPNNIVDLHFSYLVDLV